MEKKTEVKRGKIVVIQPGQTPTILEFDPTQAVNITTGMPSTAQGIPCPPGQQVVQQICVPADQPGAIKKGANAVTGTVSTGVKAAATGVVHAKEKTSGFFKRLGSTIRQAAAEHDKRAEVHKLAKEKIEACQREAEAEVEAKLTPKP